MVLPWTEFNRSPGSVHRGPKETSTQSSKQLLGQYSASTSPSSSTSKVSGIHICCTFASSFSPVQGGKALRVQTQEPYHTILCTISVYGPAVYTKTLTIYYAAVHPEALTLPITAVRTTAVPVYPPAVCSEAGCLYDDHVCSQSPACESHPINSQISTSTGAAPSHSSAFANTAVITSATSSSSASAYKHPAVSARPAASAKPVFAEPTATNQPSAPGPTYQASTSKTFAKWAYEKQPISQYSQRIVPSVWRRCTI